MSVAYRFKPVKPSLCLKEGGDDKPKVVPVAGVYPKAAAYSAATQKLGIVKSTPVHI